MLKSTLQQTDPEIYNIIQEEAERQEYGIELIASETTPPRPSWKPWAPC